MLARTTLTAGVASVLLTLAALAAPSSLAGQRGGNPPLFLAIPESFPDVDARAVLLREPGREIIVLKSTDATPETLGMALALLRRIRERPLEPGRALMVPVTGFVVRRAPEGEVSEGLEAALTRLKAQPLARVGNLGPGRSIPFGEVAR
jgi:hypothetical protein